MPDDHREPHIAPNSPDRLVVGRAESAGTDPHQHLSEPRFRNRNILKFETVEILQYRGKHLFFLL